MQTIEILLIVQLLFLAVITAAGDNNYFSIRLDKVEDSGTSSPLDRMALRLDYQGTGVRIGKAPGRWDALRLQYLNGNHLQARGKKDDLIIPVMIGFKSAMLAVAAVSSVGLFVFKSLVLSKIALVLASVLLISKLFSHENHHHQQQESKHHGGVELDYNPSEVHPVYDYSSDLGFMPTAGGQYIAYSPTLEGKDAGASATNIEPQYSQYQEVPVNNTLPPATMQRRRDFAKRKSPQPMSSYITIRRKSVSHSARDLH